LWLVVHCRQADGRRKGVGQRERKRLWGKKMKHHRNSGRTGSITAGHVIGGTGKGKTIRGEEESMPQIGLHP